MEIASRSQLRMSFLRYALVTVPLVLLLGTLAGSLPDDAVSDIWYDGLKKSPADPPEWIFGVVWPILYILMGLALAMVLHARGARGRGVAVSLFLLQLVLNLSWSPVFFGAHRVGLAFAIIVLMLGAAIGATFAFARIRKAAAWLMLPYLAWLGFAAALNYDIMRLNPEAADLAPARGTTNIAL
ncbi:MAG: TspO/MBR family protein [Sphingomonadaceae bacterium]